LVQHDEQLLLNKQQQILGGTYIHRHFSSSTDTAVLPKLAIMKNLYNGYNRKNRDIQIFCKTYFVLLCRNKFFTACLKFNFNLQYHIVSVASEFNQAIKLAQSK